MSEPTPSLCHDRDDDDLIRAHADLVYATCLRLTGHPQDAADVSQEVFIAWMRQRGQIRGPVAAWLHGTARRRSLDWLRRNHRRAQHERQVEVPAIAAEQIDDAWRGHLDACLAELDGRQRTLVLEHHVMGLSQEALATRWRLSQATISRHLTQALTRLRRGLARHGITAVTLSALPVLLASPAQAAECPPDLWAPLSAHARIHGATSLCGAGALTTWWLAWPMIIAACFAGLVVLAVGTVLIWRAVIAAGLPADPLAAYVAQLPPAQHDVAFPNGPGTHRYRSIEALIARIPPVDEARQSRIRKWLTQDGTSKPWAWLAISAQTNKEEEIPRATDLRKSTTPLVEATDQRVLLALESLMPDLLAPDATLTEAGWLAQEYRDGQFTHWGVITDLVTANTYGPRYVQRALSRRAISMADPHATLLELDALTAALHRGTYTLISALMASAFDANRDDTYLRLALHGKLSAADLQRWCQEPPLTSQRLDQALMGEPLLCAFPAMDDVLRWGDGAMAGDFTPPAEASLGFADWLNRPWLTSFVLASVNTCAWGRELVIGSGNLVAGRPEGSWIAGLSERVSQPMIVNVTSAAAKNRLMHDGKRLMAWLIAESRLGKPLPATLDDAVQAVADGHALLGGSAETYGLRYQRLSDTRFRLDIDPAGRSPAYADAVGLTTLVEDSKPPATAEGALAPVVIHAASWEADVARLTEPAAAAAIDAEPPAPTANQ